MTHFMALQVNSMVKIELITKSGYVYETCISESIFDGLKEKIIESTENIDMVGYFEFGNFIVRTDRVEALRWRK